MILTLLLSVGAPLGWGLLGAWAQVPGTRFSGPHSLRPPGVWKTEAEDTGRDPARRNWCPYQKSRLVTFVAACKTEKFLVHSQQPCPQGAPDCQKVKVMYSMAHRPVYQVKQKVLASVAWRCCPGFAGPDCQDHDPMAIPEPEDPGDSLQEPWDGPVDFEPGHPAAEISNMVEQQEHRLGDLQNDIHQGTDSLPGLWKALASNLTVATAEANQTELEFPNRSLEQVLLPHINTFLQGHLSLMWRSFNQSLHSLSQAIRNVSLDVEANRQALKRVQESSVARADFQELGAKFETKVQENAQRVGQLRQDVEGRLHAQHLSLHQSLSEVQADVDTKLKKLLKAQESPGVNSSLVLAAAGAAARPEPESLQARLGQLQRNLSALHVAAARKEEELQSTLADMKATLAQHVDEIKELYLESDDTYEQISKVERQMQELLVNHTALRELRVILMEKSLIMEENKEDVERQLLELNLTLQHLQGGHADLIKYVKDCNCQKLYFDLDVIREGQRDTTRALEETQVSLDERRQQDDSSLQALSSTVAALSQTVDAHGAEGERARADVARLRSQLRALGGEVSALRASEPEIRGEIRRLHSSFAALLEDALRHEAVLASLFGEEVMEEMSEEAPGPLPLRYEQIRTALLDAASGLQEQALGWDALAARVTALETALERASGTRGQAERLEPGRDASPEATSGLDLAGLGLELQRLSSDMVRVGQCCGASGASWLNSSLEGLRGELSTIERGLERHQRLFHSLFGNFQELVAANVSLDLGKLQAMLSRKGKKQQKGLETPRRRDRKQVGSLEDAQVKGPVLWEAGFPVAFYASFSEGTAALQTVKFNTTYINIGSSYFPEHGYFRAPERGVYLFAVSIEFGPGPGTGQLVFGGHQWTPVYTTEEQRGGSPAVVFAMAELQKGERVWFELTQGSIMKRSPPGTAFGGFLIFKT
ncbi:multimerin-2 isoform X2 [Hippopotamus amphibius kiboko]|uniref:multimerin-2 isoform X2 n=1 Tax=Hippopotamus amphibius kiboko TaxID=575201 RepID=UPI0025988C64|nr:multimerin-2 isoform X2 [Hippopotamus amphibius kiboko]